MGVWVWLRWCFFYNGVPVFSLSFYVLKLVSGVHFNESANTALLKCTEANSVCECFSVTGLDVRKYGNAELHVRATKLTQIKVIFLPSREKICFSTTRGRCLDFFFEEQMQAIYIYIYSTIYKSRDWRLLPPSLMMFYSLLTFVFKVVKLGRFCWNKNKNRSFSFKTQRPYPYSAL